MTMHRPTYYYAHPISSYGTDEEERVLASIAATGFKVFNPGTLEVQMSFEAYRENVGVTDEHPYMDYFVKITDKCDGCVFSCFPDHLSAEGVADGSMRIGAGMALELEQFFNRGAPVLWAKNTGGVIDLLLVCGLDAFDILDRDQTRALLRASGRYHK